MQYRRMGRTGLRVSALCLGTMTLGWSADKAESLRILDAALDAGITFLDTADIYSRWVEGNQGGESETILGEWMSTKPRRDIILATKARGRMWPGVNGEGLSRHHLMHAVEDSLRRLQTDYIDLYQLHAPDPETPLDETMRALDDLVRAGKVRYIGLSNYPAWQMIKANWIASGFNGARIDCIQPHHSLLHRAEFERELEPACLDQGIGVIPYSPLAAGFLTGKYARDAAMPDTTRDTSSLIQQLIADPRAFDVLDAVTAIAYEHESTPAHVALAWQLARPSITAPIIGARTVDQLMALVGAVDLKLSAEAIARLNTLSDGY